MRAEEDEEKKKTPLPLLLRPNRSANGAPAAATPAPAAALPAGPRALARRAAATRMPRPARATCASSNSPPLCSVRADRWMRKGDS